MDVGETLPELLCSICYDDEVGMLCELPCHCRFHLKCFVKFLRTRLENRSLLFIGNTKLGRLRGIRCPNVATGCESSLCSQEFLASIYLQGKHAGKEHALSEHEFEKLIRWTFGAEDENVNNVQEVSDPFLRATTKPCPHCKFRATHPHGHGCHHISPSGGCVVCGTHYCYKCLQLGEDNLRLRGQNSSCLCGYWSSFCSKFSNREEIKRFLSYEPYPQDKRCQCVVCSDCRRNFPCSQCDGNCAVCKGYLPPGPKSLADIDNFKAAVQKMQDLSPQYLCLADACKYSDWCSFQQVVSQISLSDTPVHEKDDDGRTLLHHACQHVSPNARKIIEYLIDNFHADALATDSFGKSPFEYAVQAYVSMNMREKHYSSIPGYDLQSRFSIVKKLIKSVGPCVLGRTYLDNGKPFMLWAVEQEKALELLAIFEMFPDWEYFDEQGRNLLYIAMQERKFDLVLLVLERLRTFSVNVTVGDVPLVALVGEIASEKFRDSTAKISSAITTKAINDWNLVDTQHRTVLHAVLYLYKKRQESTLTGLENIIIRLTTQMCDAAHIDVSTLTDNRGNNLLHLCLACQQRRLFDSFKKLFRKYPHLMLEQNCEGDTPLHFLVTIPHFVVVFEWIIQRSTILLPFHVMNLFMRTPLHNFCMFNEQKQLARESEDFRERAPSICTADNEAAQAIMLYLKDHPELIDFSAKDSEGSTVLHLVFRFENLSTFRLLVALARDCGKPLPFHDTDFHGDSCLHVICRIGKQSLFDSFARLYPLLYGGNEQCQWIIARMLNYDSESAAHILLRYHPDNYHYILHEFLSRLQSPDRQLLTVQSRVKETAFDLICSGGDIDGLDVAATFLQQRKILVPQKLPCNPHKNNRHALMLLLINSKLRKCSIFRDIVSRLFESVVSMDVLMQSDGDGDTLLHYLARQGDYFILDACQQHFHENILICIFENKQGKSFLQTLLECGLCGSEECDNDEELLHTADSSLLADSTSCFLQDDSPMNGLNISSITRQQGFRSESCLQVLHNIVSHLAIEAKETTNRALIVESLTNLVPFIVQARLPSLLQSIVVHFGNLLPFDQIEIEGVLLLSYLLNDPCYSQSFHLLLRRAAFVFPKEKLFAWLDEHSFLFPSMGSIESIFRSQSHIQQQPLLHFLIAKVHRSGHYGVLSALFALNLLDMNVRDDSTGNTIMHQACALGDATLVQILLDFDANFFEELDNQGYTPYARACTAECETIKSILLDHQTERFESENW